MPDTFTPEQIAQILQAFFAAVGTRQYIGARYIPIFGRKDETSILWDNSAPYEPLTIVLYQGNSYTSRQYVPAGIEITNEAFWANTGNYNAQVEAYRQEVAAFDSRITANTTAISTLENNVNNDISEINEDISSLSTSVTERFTETNGNVSALQQSLTDNVDNLQDDIDALGSKCLWIGDSFSRNFDYYLPKKVSAMLHCELVTEAVAGCGFVRYYNGSNFQMQADSLISQYQNDPTVKYVIIYGGWNDREQVISDINTAVSTTMGQLNAAFPNAIKVMFGPQCPQPVRIAEVSAGTYLSQVAERYKYYSVLNNFVYVPAFMWNLSRPSQYWVDTDTTHPSQQGFDAIASYMMESLFSNNVIMNDPYNVPSDYYSIRSTDPNVANLTINNANVWMYQNKLYLNMTIAGWSTDNPEQCFILMPFNFRNMSPAVTNAPYGRNGVMTWTRGATAIRVRRTDTTQDVVNIAAQLDLV